MLSYIHLRYIMDYMQQGQEETDRVPCRCPVTLILPLMWAQAAAQDTPQQPYQLFTPHRPHNCRISITFSI